jgi:hypothetical protein
MSKRRASTKAPGSSPVPSCPLPRPAARAEAGCARTKRAAIPLSRALKTKPFSGKVHEVHRVGRLFRELRGENRRNTGTWPRPSGKLDQPFAGHPPTLPSAASFRLESGAAAGWNIARTSPSVIPPVPGHGAVPVPPGPAPGPVRAARGPALGRTPRPCIRRPGARFQKGSRKDSKVQEKPRSPALPCPFAPSLDNSGSAGCGRTVARCAAPPSPRPSPSPRT